MSALDKLISVATSALNKNPQLAEQLRKTNFAPALERLKKDGGAIGAIVGSLVGDAAGSAKQGLGGALGSIAKSLQSNSGEDVKRAEEVFMMRVLRYASDDGKLDAQERAELEAFAQKHSIDELRMEELIEEAFKRA